MAKKDEEPQSEFETPPNTKVRIVATIDVNLRHEMEGIHDREERDAEEHDRTKPDWSNTVEMLLRKGVKTYKSESKK